MLLVLVLLFIVRNLIFKSNSIMFGNILWHLRYNVVEMNNAIKLRRVQAGHIGYRHARKYNLK